MISKTMIKRYCSECEKIENYEEAINDDKRWDCHHRFETHFSDGTERPVNAFLTPDELKALNMYWRRPADELIFLTHSEHQKLHLKNTATLEKLSKSMSEGKMGHNVSEETRKKLSEYWTGKPSLNKKKVRCIELNKTFDSLKEAAKYVGLSSHSHISHVIHGNRKTAGGYHWELV